MLIIVEFIQVFYTIRKVQSNIFMFYSCSITSSLAFTLTIILNSRFYEIILDFIGSCHFTRLRIFPLFWNILEILFEILFAQKLLMKIIDYLIFGYKCLQLFCLPWFIQLFWIFNDLISSSDIHIFELYLSVLLIDHTLQSLLFIIINFLIVL